MRSVNQVDLKIENELTRINRERDNAERTWIALLSKWGSYHRKRWHSRQGVGKNILNIKPSPQYVNEDLERHLERISVAYGRIKGRDRYTALQIIQLFAKQSSQESMCLKYKWSRTQYYTAKKNASETLRGGYLTV